MKRTLQPLPKRKVTWQVEVDESERLRNALRVVVKLRAAARHRPAQLRGAQTACCTRRAGKLDRARSRVYRRRCLQVNMRWNYLKRRLRKRGRLKKENMIEGT